LSVSRENVSLRNSKIVHRLLSKAKQLRATTAYRKVFISLDRSPQERAKHRELVIAMRDRAKKDPDRHFYIRSGKLSLYEIRSEFKRKYLYVRNVRVQT
jgi:hypothetical protein